MSACIIAHDLGTSSDKAVLVDASGEVLAFDEVAYPAHTPAPGWVEQNPEDYWNAVTTATRNLLAKSNIRPGAVKGIVFSTQAMGIIPVSANGQVLHPNITWVDGRAEKEAQWLMKRFIHKKIFKAIVGIEITGKDVIPKLIWLKNNRPEIYRQTTHFLDVNGYLKFRCTGKRVTEWSGACSYAFNLKKKDWEYIFFRIAGIDTSKLPPLVRSTDFVGNLTRQAADALGLTQDVAVFGGCDDTQSAALGTGSIDEGAAHIYLGTSAWAGITTARNTGFRNGAVTLQSADPAKNLIVGITESAGANHDWFLQNFYKDCPPGIGTRYEIATRELNHTRPGADYLIFTPWFLGERCPVSTTTVRSTVFNLTHQHTRADLFRAMLEGVGYNLRWTLENLQRDFRFNINTLRVAGGGSQNDFWMQGLADITGKTIETVTNPKLSGALGVAAIAMVGAGIYSDFSCIHNFVKVKKQFTPDPDNQQIYNEIYTHYKALYHALKKNYHMINARRFTSNHY